MTGNNLVSIDGPKYKTPAARSAAAHKLFSLLDTAQPPAINPRHERNDHRTEEGSRGPFEIIVYAFDFCLYGGQLVVNVNISFVPNSNITLQTCYGPVMFG